MAGKIVASGGGRQPGVSLVLQDVDIGVPTVQFGFLGSVRREMWAEEVDHVWFIMHITRKQAQCHFDRTWETPAEEEVLRAAEVQSEAKCIGCGQATVVQWVALHPLLDVYMRETGYEGGGWDISSCWRKGKSKEML